jgi:hypothetical protein
MSLTDAAISGLMFCSDRASVNEAPRVMTSGGMPNIAVNCSFQMMIRFDASTMQSACDMLLMAASRHWRETDVRWRLSVISRN